MDFGALAGLEYATAPCLALGRHAWMGGQALLLSWVLAVPHAGEVIDLLLGACCRGSLSGSQPSVARTYYLLWHLLVKD